MNAASPILSAYGFFSPPFGVALMRSSGGVVSPALQQAPPEAAASPAGAAAGAASPAAGAAGAAAGAVSSAADAFQALRPTTPKAATANSPMMSLRTVRFLTLVSVLVEPLRDIGQQVGEIITTTLG